ncbi:hydrogenase large subunit [Sideroxydans lithotrophicus]|uniref:NADH dehydrogenase (Ubiquinone) 30 kDa subunit n=1 Tax=Sideroxydans lithotrophicus (strain ES-1) TaxID=580332 RepID=D5CN88_SIDLE|nr:NADH-quinone oxidoreductase subunit C [Sideroxydans lithotrophicus]ADE12785.1 NADH dehydrogenase (ubiquinone) 30 kDa subunit [Sideroxydans lithotrophicus ES-1]
MPIKHPNLKLTRLTDALPAWTGEIGPDDLHEICRQVHDGGGRLVALWGSDTRQQDRGFQLHVLLLNETGMVCLNVQLSAEQPVYPDISQIFPAASRMQRATYDMLGIYAQEGHDHRKWVRHGAWHSGSFPLRKDFDAAASRTDEADAYPFVQVEGQGVHEIPVGPVHAGIIEPGHFRFSIIGERVLRLEERLGYVHKGIEKRFESMSLQQGAKLAGRVSGDSTVAYAWAYAMAAESIAKVTPPSRALWMRALLLERERVANHLGDLGYLGNDVALAFGFAQFWILKEQVLRNNAALFGHRYLMDTIAPGGVAVTLSAEGKRVIEAECAMLEQQVRILRGIYDEHAGVQDRFIGTGVVTPKLAAQLGLCGLAGRASAQAWDARVQFACAPYDKLDVQMSTYRNGDVASRAIVRFGELFESLRLQREILVNLIHEDEAPAALAKLPPNGFGIGMVEGWRGEVMVAIHTDAQGNLTRVHPHDPSWQNWPLLEHAIIDNIVPDFPLINKSFNLSYSGQDL